MNLGVVEVAMVRISTLGIAMMLTGSVVAAQQADDSQVRARQRIAMMEGTLESAVKIGAENLLRQVRSAVPDPPMLAGYPEVHGFRLDGYGIFFDVGVPMLRLPVTWPLRTLITSDNRDLESVAAELKQLIAQMDARYQPQFAQAVRRLELRAQAQNPISLRAPGAGTVAANQVAVAPQVNVDARVLDNPAEGYTREVKAALIDAMIENSGPLALGPEEWLTVAARDNVPRDPLSPGDTADFSTIIFRVKGSDLATFRGGRMTLEEARQKVEVREY
jgi:hypothetical protein